MPQTDAVPRDRHATARPGPELAGATLALLATTAAIAVANLYYNQPLLADMARSFGGGAHAVASVPTLTQLGYAVGLFLLVPLGDVVELRSLIAVTLGATSAALVGVALAPTAALLAVGSFAVGACTVAPQLVVPFVVRATPPERRGAAVGTVVGALLVGILLSRTFSGVVGAHLGWRAVYWIAAPVMLALGVVSRAALPAQPPTAALRYGALLASLPSLVRRHAVLREAAVTGALTFGAFSAFWTTLAFLLATIPARSGGSYGSAAAGLFGLVGVVGALAAPVAGRLGGGRNPRVAVAVGVGVTGLAFVVFVRSATSIPGLVVGVVLLDLGAQASSVANQVRIAGAAPDAESRVNTVYRVSYFIGGAMGSAAGMAAWSRWGWPGVCVAGGLMLLLALLAVVAPVLSAARVSSTVSPRRPVL